MPELYIQSEFILNVVTNNGMKAGFRMCHLNMMRIQNLWVVGTIHNVSGGMVEWLMRLSSNLSIASHIGLNPVRDKPLFP